MGFENGLLSVSMFYLSEKLDTDVISSFANNALPPLEILSNEPLYGWVTGRHMLDRNITGETARLAGRLRLTLVKAEKKIPEALLRAECAMEELAELEATNSDRLPRAKRTEIRNEVIKRLMPQMPPTLTGIPVVYDGQANILYAGATTDKQIDALVMNFEKTTRIKLIALTPETAALKRKKHSVKDMTPTSFSPECTDEMAVDSIGMDFMTWLWFFFEAKGGTMMWGQEAAGVMIQGPLTLFMEGQGAHVTVLRNGEPLIASEAKTAMLGGKKVKRARVVMTIGDQTFSATVDAESFVMRSAKLPKNEAMDRISNFEARMIALGRFRDMFLHLYDRFIDERIDPVNWKETRKAIHQWLPARTGKA